MQMARIFVVDDHPIVRQTYALLIQREPGFELCGEATNAQEAIARIPVCAPDVVVLDVSLQGGMDGIELLQLLRKEHETLPILIVSGHDEQLYAERLLLLGARGYVMKGDAVAFLNGLHRVLAESGGETVALPK